MNKDVIRNILQLVLFLSLGVLILYFVYRQQSAQYLQYCIDQGNSPGACRLSHKILADLKTAKSFWLILTVGLYFINNISRAIRWRMLAEAEFGVIRSRNTFFAIFVGYLTNLAVPRMGEFVRAGVLSRYEKIPTAGSLGTVVSDRLLDVLTLMLIFGLGLLLASGDLFSYLRTNTLLPEIHTDIILVGFGLILLLLGLAFYLIRRNPEHRIVRLFRGKIKEFGRGLLSIRKVKRKGWFIFHSLNIWLMYYLMTYLPFYSFESTAPLGPVAALLVFIFGGLGMILPAPGGMGTFHAMIIAGLSIYGVAGPDAFSFAMILFLLFNISLNVIMGVLSLILLPVVNKNYHPKRNHGNE